MVMREGGSAGLERDRPIECHPRIVFVETIPKRSQNDCNESDDDDTGNGAIAKLDATHGAPQQK